VLCADVPCLHPLLTVWVDHVTINILPDDVLLHIFHFIRLSPNGFSIMAPGLWWIDWIRLVHVCRKWRSVIFASPNFLDLTLGCFPWTRVDLTHIWPPFPIIIETVDGAMPEDYDFNAAIVHPNRVCKIYLPYFESISQLQRLASAMQEPFPAMRHLTLRFNAYRHGPASAPALPDGFLAPRLQSLDLTSIPFPTLPKLLFSATGLVLLTLRSIPHSGYFSPEAIVTGLAMSTTLESLTIGFESPLSRPDWESRRPPSLIRTVFPVLTRFEFKGVSEYLEELMARIDAPLLDSIYITFFNQLIFDIPQLAQFMRRTARFLEVNEAHVFSDYSNIWVGYLPPTETYAYDKKKSGLRISCEGLDWQLSSLAQVFTSFLPSIYMVEQLYFYGPHQPREDDEDMQYLEILRPFTTVKNLYMTENFARCVAPTLKHLVGERAIDVFPALESLFLEEPWPRGPLEEPLPWEPVQVVIERFTAARELLGHPVAVSRWNEVPYAAHLRFR
jgi:hypothetical protein